MRDLLNVKSNDPFYSETNIAIIVLSSALVMGTISIHIYITLLEIADSITSI